MKVKNLIALALTTAALLSGCAGADAPETQTVPSTEQVQTEPVQTTGAPEAAKLDLADGVYSVAFHTDSSMFRANEAHDRRGVLTVKDGVGTLHISLGSKNIVNLYKGLAADAPGDEAHWLHPTVDTVTYSDGLTEEVNGFDVAVDALDTEFDLALIGKKGVWYDHKVSVSDPIPVESQEQTVTDGAYICQVTLSGGSGRATVESPAAVTVEGGKMTATIVWSSPNYEYMLVDDVRDEPIQTEGNSTFCIPIRLDEDMAVSASTVAMSQPHLVDYVLHFSDLRSVNE